MHILIGSIVGCVVSVALTFIASRVIDRPLTWKDVAASAAAGIIGGAIATATLGVGAAGTLRTVTAFAAGGATGSASGQITDNVLHGHPVGEGVGKATAFGTVIGAGTLGLGKGLGHVGRATGLMSASSASSAGGHSNSLAGAAAGLDDAIVPVWRYVKKALAEDPAEGEHADDEQAEDSAADAHADPFADPVNDAELQNPETLPTGVAQEAPQPAAQGAMGRLQGIGF